MKMHLFKICTTYTPKPPNPPQTNLHHPSPPPTPITHHQACHANNPLYGRTVRLAQVWAGNHYLHPAAHLPLEAIELMVAWLFARPLPFQVYIYIYTHT